MEHVGDDADLVQRAAKEKLVGGQPHQIELAGRHHDHAIGSRGKVVVLHAARLEIGRHGFAGRAKVHDRLANLLHLRPQAARRGRTNDQPGHARVHLGLVNRVNRRAQRRRLPQELAEDVRRLDLAEWRANVQVQRGVRADRHGAATSCDSTTTPTTEASIARKIRERTTKMPRRADTSTLLIGVYSGRTTDDGRRQPGDSASSGPGEGPLRPGCAQRRHRQRRARHPTGPQSRRAAVPVR